MEEQVEMVCLAEFRENPDNPQTVTDEAFARLIGKLQRVPDGLKAHRIAFVTDDPGGGRMVLSGNKRLRALKQIHGEGGMVPAAWFQDITGLSPAERHEFIVDMNVTDGEWDLDKLLSQYGRDELSDLMDEDALAKLLEGFEEEEPTEGETDPDQVPLTPEEPKSVRGAIYSLGRHRLMCGDATSMEDVSALLGGATVDLVLTDPPYNVAYTGGTKDALTIENDSMGGEEYREFLSEAFKAASDAMRPGAVFYVWHGDSEGLNVRSACAEAGWKVRECLVWAKDAFVLGRQDYQWQHEPCLYGWKDGAAHAWNSDRSQTTVLEFARPKRSAEHPTMKPVELFEYLMRNSSKEGDAVFDGFAGSGTTGIACEALGRTAYLMELDPRYCDVIRKRWAEFAHGEGVDWESLAPVVESRDEEVRA